MTKSDVSKWARYEITLTSTRSYANPFQAALLKMTFVSPSDRRIEVDGFWDGDDLWRVRFLPDEIGTWHYTSYCSDHENTGLHAVSGTFTCDRSDHSSIFSQHGPISLSASRRHLQHADGTPYFWLADTAWNGPLWASDDQWNHYLSERVRQKFTAVQWVATHWLGAPQGNADHQMAFTGDDLISVNPAFFQHLDKRHEQILRAGLLSAPVILWTAGWCRNHNDYLSPGFTIPEDQAILLARYIVARWGADPVLWMLAGDGDYRASNAERWKRIGRAVFGGKRHAPVTLHPQGLQWNMPEFRHEEWLDVAGYQSCHFDNDTAYGWLAQGDPAVDWIHTPARPIINLEPNYENISAVDTGRTFTDTDVRRAIYRSLLIAPTAGVTYGAHGVWDWSDGTKPAVGHEVFGIPTAWWDGLNFAGANQIPHLYHFFTRIPWWDLLPAVEMVASHMQRPDKANLPTASRSQSGDLALVYVPTCTTIELDTRSLAPGLRCDWYNVRTGEVVAAAETIQRIINLVLTAPDQHDWIIWFHKN